VKWRQSPIHVSSPCCIPTAVRCWTRRGPALSARSGRVASVWHPGETQPRPFSTLFPSLTRGSHAGELGDRGRVPLDGHTYTQTKKHTHCWHARPCTVVHTYTHRCTHFYTHTQTHTPILTHMRLRRPSEEDAVSIFGSFRKLSFVAYHVPCQVCLGNKGCGVTDR
jgi:hypothetical protein